MSNNQTDEDNLNRSVEAPIEGVYRYELIPAETPMNYHIELWYQFGMGDDPKKLLETLDDAVYLNKGDSVVIDSDGKVSVKKRGYHLKLVVTNA